jgi:Lar family restriction alleviation protein
MMELKNCPFCGSKSVKLITSSIAISVICFNCGGSGAYNVDKEAAIKAWNTRATPEECNCNSLRTSISNPELCGACGKLIPPEEEG